jgi:hypothetical protein
MVVPTLWTSPILDSASYYTCIRDATKGAFKLHLFRCADHSSIAYVLLVGLTQYIDFGNVQLVYLADALLAAAAGLAFYKLLRLLLGNSLSELERAIILGIFFTTPAFLAHIIHINLDFPLACFFVLFLASLLYRRPWFAAFFGAAMAFTKETGMAAYAASFLLFVCIFPLMEWRKTGWKRAMSEIAPLAIPGMLIVLYFLLLWMKGWNAHWGLGEKDIFLIGFNLAHRTTRGFFIDIFVLNFHWLLSLTICIAIVLASVRFLRGKRHEGPAVDLRAWLFVSLLFLPVLYIVTRFVHWNNARYTLIAFPLLFLLFAAALASLSRRTLVRIIPLAIVAVTIFLSNFRTLDPLSKAYFGTFQFGSHELLTLNRDSFPWYARDDIVYNLEFRMLQGVSQDIVAALHPTPATLFVTNRAGDFFFPPAIDPQTRAPALRFRYAYPLLAKEMSPDITPAVVRLLTPENVFYYVDYPNFFGRPALALARSHFRQIASKTFERSGYTVTLYTFEVPGRRSPPSP